MKTSPSSPAPQTETCDLVVAGGGIGGVVAAITAARHGCRVVLIHDRSVLGGNASSEIKVLIAGANAMGYNKDARETGVLEELLVENSARSIDPGAALLDDVLWEWVTREPNITLFLNTQVTRVTKDPSGRIAAVHALKAWSENELTVQARFFADCTGDAVMANAAGAAWRMGREAKSEFGETMAQDVADSKVLGCTLGFQCRDQGKPVPFVPPPFACDFSDPDSFPLRHHNRINFAPWWAEWGGELDPIHQYQEIKDELTRIVYGLWDHLKNHGDHGMENYALIRIATVLGKRESRRVEGPHMLTEKDITSYRAFPDAVGYGGWPIDLHPPEGIYSKEAPADQIFVNPFEIPLRCLYSKNVENLFTVGRDVSVSHVALGSTRVMGTIATMGQAVGTAVAVCLRDHIEPHQLEPAQIAEIQQTLLREDAYLIRQRNEDPCDAARFATVTATSDAPLFMETGSDWQPLEKGCAQLFPVTEGHIDSIRLFLKNTAEEPVEVGLKLHAASHLFDFSSAEVLAEATVSIPAGTAGWAEFPVNCVAPRGLYWVEVSQTPGVLWWRNTECEPAGTKTAERSADGSEWVAYRGYHVVDTATWITFRGCYTFRLTPDSRPHTPDQVINGVSRAVDWPNVWASDPTSHLPQSLTLTFRQPVTLGSVLLTFDTDLDHRVPPRFSPLAVKDYRLWAESNGAEYLVAEVRDNYHRRRSHSAPGMRAQSLRLEVLATNGAPSTRVFEIRVYEKAVPGFACRPA